MQKTYELAKEEYVGSGDSKTNINKKVILSNIYCRHIIALFNFLLQFPNVLKTESKVFFHSLPE